MLIPLFLFQKKIINSPAFYISAYLEAHRKEYYERLRAVSRDDDWTGWCKFFLRATHSQAETNLKTITQISNLYNSLKERLPQLTRSRFGIIVLDGIFEYPYFQLSKFVNNLNIPDHSARRLIKILEAEGILKTIIKGKGSSPAFMIFPELLNIAEGEKAF